MKRTRILIVTAIDASHRYSRLRRVLRRLEALHGQFIGIERAQSDGAWWAEFAAEG